MDQKSNRVVKYGFPLIAFFIFVGAWEGIDALFSIREIVVPSPSEIARTTVKDISFLLEHIGITAIEGIVGFFIGSGIGLITAIAFTFVRSLRIALYPYAIALKAVPAYALAPLLVLWFGNTMLPKMIMAAIVSFFPVLVNSVKGFSATTKEKEELFQSLKATRTQVFFKLQIPSALPYIFQGLKIGSTYAILGATLAEFMGSSKGIGFVIINASYYLETSRMFAAIVMIAITGIALFYFIEYIEKRVVFWRA